MANSTSFTYSKKLKKMLEMLFEGAAFWLKDSSKKNVLYMLLHLSSFSALTCPTGNQGH
jgi:hypothetical protein